MRLRSGRKVVSPATVLAVLLATVMCLWAMAPEALAFTLRVTDPRGNPVQGFRWLLEVDNTHPVDPGAHIGPVPVKAGSRPERNPLALSLHRSYSPIVASGSSATNTAAINFLSDGVTPLPKGRYMLSVLPYAGYTMGGTNLVLPEDQGVRVFVAPQPIATAQIAVKVFHDIRPTNNAPDVAEVGLPGFSVLLFDTFGQVTLDAFGNPLGTTYKFICDATGKNPGTGTSVCLRADGSPFVDVLAPNSFEILSDANGEARIKYLVPGKYGIQVVPPAGQGWHQTTTIEGTLAIDAWVRPNEPPFLVEFGPPFWHAFYGFVQDFNAIPPPAPGEVAVPITGQVLKGHLSRPPAITFHPGAPPSTSPCLVALTVIGAAADETIYAGQCVEDGFFTIPDVPPGLYQLVVWDQFLDIVIYFTTVSVPDGAAVGAIPVPMWFAEQEHYVFSDTNANGFRDPGEMGIPDQNVNLRFRDGSIYQTFPTDATGYVPFEQVFPFFKWQVAEVDFATQKATGLTVVVDDGGAVTNDEFGEGKRTPQRQATDGSDPANEGTDPRYRLQTGPVLTQAYQNFAGQNLRFEWGKSAYARGENGGISGIVRYATTRAENNPARSAPDNWEPGIPRVQVNLYQDRLNNRTGAPARLGDGRPDDRDGDGRLTRPDVDNHPLGFSECTDRNNDGKGDGGCTAAGAGPEDVDRDGDGLFDLGDAYRFTHTDSWDDSLPSGCRGDAEPANVHGKEVPISDCAEGLRTWNQVRPGVFDGGYAFGPNVTGDPADNPLSPGSYIVEAVAPPGYEHQKEEDKNVELGDPSVPSPLLLAPPCVGAPHVVPPYLSLQTDEAGTPLPGILPRNLIAAPFAGQSRPLCDRKQVLLSQRQNGAADFYLFTKVPKSARVVGLITDDLANELAPGKPSFTEKFSPGWMPISVTDYSGREIIRFYDDEFGAVAPYLNTLQTAAAADEGGNFVQLLLTPLSPTGDYHIGAGSAALDAATNAVQADHPDLAVDFDGDTRPDGDCPDIGADEAVGLGGVVPGGCGPLTFPTNPPDPPVALNDLFAVNSFNLFAVPVPGVLANDSDADGDVLSATLVPASLSGGSLSLNPNGSFSWAPPSTAWVGSASFRYTAGDGVSQSGEATVTLNKDLSVMQADFDRSALRWLVRGATTAPVGTWVTVYLGPPASGQVIGVATVARNAQGALRWRLVAVAGGSVPMPRGVDTVSAKAATGAEVLGAPLTVHP